MDRILRDVALSFMLIVCLGLWSQNAAASECLADLNNDGTVNAADLALLLGSWGPCPQPTRVFIPAGKYEMGDHFDVGGPDEQPVHTVYVDSFHMDVYEVTNQQYANALNWAWSEGHIQVSGSVVYSTDGGTAYCDTTTSSSFSRITWDGSTFGVLGKELCSEDLENKTNHPMGMVSWYGAAAYANWRSEQHGLEKCYDPDNDWECDFSKSGYRLPTEAEWEYAARGGLYYNKYPWGDTINGSNANYYQSGDPYDNLDQPWTTPVGYYDGGQMPRGSDMANGYGLYDMAGNVFEWCNDWYDEDYYGADLPDEWPPNPTGPLSGTQRVLRGGSCNVVVATLRTAVRVAATPDNRYHSNGFRVVARP